MADAKRYRSAGFLTGWRIEADPAGEGWRIQLLSLGERSHLVDARQQAPRVFVSLDGAVSALKQIGFSVRLIQESL
jgi:hypothetical protein